ncbi:unnamed protein product [Heligmosomoides polygyrus]|uniref:Secreted protein n=1 Tax=Heligmosomoides polygyrus TaxID=6339 RepID=A0A183FDU5_HELPZ|nr:unnamed protein product [Heligmosomoides polygyrus]
MVFTFLARERVSARNSGALLKHVTKPQDRLCGPQRFDQKKTKKKSAKRGALSPVAGARAVRCTRFRVPGVDFLFKQSKPYNPPGGSVQY